MTILETPSVKVLIKISFSHNMQINSLSETMIMIIRITFEPIAQIGLAASIKIIVKAFVTEGTLMSIAENHCIYPNFPLN